jgi:hypothetical protein
MATIRYNIEIGPDGTPSVQQDVIQIDSTDKVVFWTTASNVPSGKAITIEFPRSPFRPDADAPQSGELFAVRPLDTTRHPVDKANETDGVRENVPSFGIRKTFQFNCGLADVDPKTSRAIAGTFESWNQMPNNGVAAASHTAAATAHTAAAVALTPAGADPASGSSAAWTAAAAAHTAAAAAHKAAAAATATAISAAAGSLPSGGSDGN